MKEKLKKNWKEYLVYALLGLWILAFAVIFYASAQAGCPSDAGVFQSKGTLCLARGLAGLSCYAGYLGLWTFIGWGVAQGKGRNPLIGCIMGLTLQFIGCFILMTLEPRRDITGRMIGWDEYKHLTAQEQEAMKPVRVPPSPEMKKRTKVGIGILIFAAIFGVLQVLHNLGII